jgi:hypothetical protein
MWYICMEFVFRTTETCSRNRTERKKKTANRIKTRQWILNFSIKRKERKKIGKFHALQALRRTDKTNGSVKWNEHVFANSAFNFVVNWIFSFKSIFFFLSFHFQYGASAILSQFSFHVRYVECVYMNVCMYNISSSSSSLVPYEPMCTQNFDGKKCFLILAVGWEKKTATPAENNMILIVKVRFYRLCSGKCVYVWCLFIHRTQKTTWKKSAFPNDEPIPKPGRVKTFCQNIGGSKTINFFTMFFTVWKMKKLGGIFLSFCDFFAN